MRVIDTRYRHPVRALAFSPDGRVLAVGAEYRGVSVHDLAGGDLATSFEPHDFPGRVVIGFEPAGRVLLVVTAGGRLRFDLDSHARAEVGPRDPAARGRLLSFGSSADGGRLVTVQSEVGRYLLIGWEATTVGWERRWSAEVGELSDPAVAPAGDRVAVLAGPTPNRWAGYRLQVRDAATGEPVGDGAYDYSLLARPHFRPDGRQLVAAHDRYVLVWDARVLGKPALVRNDSRKHFTAAAYHPSGRYLFTTSSDATVSVWDTDSWVRVKRLAWDIGELRAVAVSPDGLLAAAGSDRGRVVVWDVDV
jgi:WD40 repeat protein